MNVSDRKPGDLDTLLRDNGGLAGLARELRQGDPSAMRHEPAANENAPTRVMTVRPRYPFAWLGVPLIMLLLFTFGPMVILLTGGIVADALGCTIPINGPTGACPFMGVDLATYLATAVALGYLAFLTFPVGTTLLTIWLAAVIIVTLIWCLRWWRASSKAPGVR
jgi:hypothetical protein